MTERILLCLTVLTSCLLDVRRATNNRNVPYPGLIPEEAVNIYNRGISGAAEETNKNDKDEGGVRCQECSIVKSMDNTVISVLDEVTHTAVSRCQEWPCESGQDWCLVTYYKNSASGVDAQNKHEVHECGSKQQRDNDYRCTELLKEDSQGRISYCKTKRSASTDSVFAVSLSVLMSLLFMFLY